MRRSIKVSIIFLLTITMCLTILTGCGNKQEETIVEQEEPQEVEEVVEVVVDEKIKDADNYLAALKYLNFEEIDLEKEYTLEQLTIYLMKLFRLEDKAIKADYQCPYSNIFGNSKPYMSYAYATWIIKDVEQNDLCQSIDNVANNCLAIILRLMGYSDRNKEDFDCKDAIGFAKELGIVYEGETGKLRGDQLVKILWEALESDCKDDMKLKDRFIRDGLFTKINYEDAQYLSKGEEIPERKVYKPSTPQTTNSFQTTDANYSGGNYDDSNDSGGGNGGSGGGGGDSGGGGGETPVTPSEPDIPDSPPSGGDDNTTEEVEF